MPSGKHRRSGSFDMVLKPNSRLSEDERAYVKARLLKDQGRSAAERRITFTDVVNVFRDYKVFVMGVAYFGLIVPAYGYASCSIFISFPTCKRLMIEKLCLFRANNYQNLWILTDRHAIP